MSNNQQFKKQATFSEKDIKERLKGFTLVEEYDDLKLEWLYYSMSLTDILMMNYITDILLINDCSRCSGGIIECPENYKKIDQDLNEGTRG